MSSVDAAGLKPPPGVWMHKARSKRDGQNAVFGMLKGATGNSWNRRFVWVEGTKLFYGQKRDSKEKEFDIKSFKYVSPVLPKRLKADGAPDVFLNFGWEFKTTDQTTTFVCESIEARDVYVAFMQQFVAVAPAAPSSSSAGASAAPSSARLGGPGDGPMSIAAQAQARTHNNAAGAGAGGGDDDDEGGPGVAAKSQRELRNLVGGDDEDDFDLDADELDLSDDDDDDDDDEGPGVAAKSQRELRNLVGGDDEDDLDLDADDLDLSDDDDDDDDDDDYDFTDDDSDDEGGGGRGGRREKKQETQAQVFDRILSPIAQQVYAHVPYKHDDFASELAKHGEKPSDIVFSRSVAKIAKKDNVHERDMVVTRRNMYLFAAGSFLGGLKCRVIELDQLVGVLESTLEPNLFAILIPSFHDVLIRITPMKSPVKGTEVEVKQQLIAHLYKGCAGLAAGREFLFREAENIRELIRRTEDDEHQPLEGLANDALQASLNAKLYPTFRINAESQVHLSRYVERVNAQMQHSSRMFIVTDGGVYLAPADGTRVSVRESLPELSGLKYDTDTQTLLLQFVDYDMLIVVRNTQDFDAIRTALPQIIHLRYHRTLNAVPSRSLKSTARLRDAKKLADHLSKGKGATGRQLQAGVKKTQKALLQSLMSSAAKAKELGQGIRAIGMGSVKVLKTGVCSIGGVLVDNQIASELLGAAQSLGKHQRVLHEGCLTMRDEAALFKVPRGESDTLHLDRTGSMSAAKVSRVFFSSRCKLYNITAHIETNKTADLVVVVCDRGIYLFDDPSVTDSGFLANALLKLRTDKGYNVSDKIKWPVVTGVARCSQEPNVLAIVTNDQRSNDVMIRVGNTALADKFVAHFCNSFRSSEDHRGRTPAFYTTDTADSLRAALKRTTFDPELIVALHRHRISDAIGIAVVPDIVETIRRYGDNRVLFSGIAWRFRGSRVRKGAEKMEGLLEKHSHSADSRKDFKSFILIVTNCAIYYCNKGGFEIARRTEIRAVDKVSTSTEDPDAVLLHVPSEYDMFLRVEGRVKELIDRLQDAVAEWTTYNLYLPHEGKGSHDIAEYVFPIVEQPSLVAAGNLDRPAGFKEAQARRNAADVRRSYNTWFDKDMEASAGAYEDEIKAAKSWTQEQTGHGRRICRIRHSFERAFAFGFRAETSPPMARLVLLLRDYERRDGVIQRLTRGLETDDAALYEQAITDASKLKVGVGRLILEQSRACTELRAKASVLEEIRRILDENEHSIEEYLPQLERLFLRAAAARIHEARVSELRHDLSLCLQRRRMSDALRVAGRTPGRFSADAKSVLLSAADQVNVNANVRQSVIDSTDPMHRWAINSIDSAIVSGNVERLVEAIEGVARLDASVGAAVKDHVVEAERELKALRDAAEHIAKLEALCDDLRQKMNSMEALRLAMSLKRLESFEMQFNASEHKCLARYRSLAALYIDRVEERLGVVQSKEARRAEELAAAAEHRERVRQREAERERQREAERLEREHEDRERRFRMAGEWGSEAERLLYNMKQHVAAEDHNATSNTIKACDALATHIVDFVEQLNHEAPASGGGTLHMGDMTILGNPVGASSPSATSRKPPETDDRETILLSRGHISLPLTGVSLDEQQSLQPVVEKVLNKLRTARQVGALYQQKQREKRSHVLPPAVVNAIRQLNKAAVMQYLDKAQGNGLTTDAVAEIRTEWLRAVKDARWAQQLHARIHQAVALKNHSALELELNLAKSKNHSDAVVASARDWLERTKAEAAREHDAETGRWSPDPEDKEAAAEEAAADQAAAKEPEPTKPKKPAPVVYKLMHGWPPKAAKSIVATNASELTQATVTHPENTVSPASSDQIRLYCHRDENGSAMKAILDTWHALLAHRIKPAGFFRKTERSLVDVVAFVGQLERKGDIVAPFSNHLIGEIERVKKLNHSRGQSTSTILIKFLLQKGDVLRFIEDLLAMLPKEAEDIYYEDSVWRCPSEEERKDLRLMAKMLTQIEWPFQLEDRDEAALLRSNATSASPAGTTGASARVIDEAALLTADKDQRTAIRAVQSLRKSIGRIGNYFAQEMNRLSSGDVASSAVAGAGKSSGMPSNNHSSASLSDLGATAGSFAGSASRDPAALKNIFDENSHRTVGLLIRGSLCAAISSVLLVGFRTSHMFVKRHLWDLFKAAAERLRQSARGFGAIALPDAVEMVENLTDVETSASAARRGAAAALAGKSDAEVNDIRVRMLYSHALNQQSLGSFLLDAIFDEHESSAEFLDKYYHTDAAVLMQPETRAEVAAVLDRLGAIPFVISVDAELW